MKIFRSAVIILFFLPFTVINADGNKAPYEIGVPVKFLEGCEVDLDGDTKQDMALLLENPKSTMLIVLMQRGDEYDSHILFRSDSSSLNLYCKYASKLVGTLAGESVTKSKEGIVDGAYLLISQPESSRVAFYWNGSNFKKIWLAD